MIALYYSFNVLDDLLRQLAESSPMSFILLAFTPVQPPPLKLKANSNITFS
jgi:hypothetical protein